jgi:Na+-driven multidrug efflux pump
VDIGCVVGFFCLQKVLTSEPVFKTIIDSTASSTNTAIESTILKRIFQFIEIGLPIALTEAGWIISNFCTYKIFASFPTGVDAQAAWTIRMKLDELIFLTPIMAMSMTAATLAGQHLGAGNARLARRVTFQIALASCLVSFAVCLAMSSFSTSIAGCFSQESKIIEFTAQLIDVAPWILPVMSIYLILFGAMEGAGFTRLPMIAIVTGLFFIRLPTSWLFGVVLDKQVPGVVAAVLMSNLVLAIWACALFRSRKWERTGC